MRVLIYGFAGSILGGIEVFVLKMNEHMSKDCIFDYLIDDDQDCAFKNRIYKRGGNIFYVPWIRQNPMGFIRKIWKILGVQKQNGTKIFYYQLYSMTKLLPAIMAKMRGYTVILHAHNNGLQKNSKFYLFMHKIGKLIARCLKFVYLTNSQLSSDFMFGKNVKSELIYNAIDKKSFLFSQSTRKEVREEISCGERIVVGFVGRFVLQKNPLFMIRIFAEINKICPKSELWIIGEGELQNQMELQIKEMGIELSVKWLGCRDDVNRLMQGMDILLQPSLFEGLGIVLIEAQATGLAVISSEKVIPQEAIVSDFIKLLPLQDSPSLWAQKSLSFLASVKKLNRNEAKITEHYDINFESRHLEKLLEKYHLT